MPASREILAHLRSSVYLRLRSHQVDLVNLPRNWICAQLLHRCGTRGLLFRPISGQKAVLRMLQLTICLLLYLCTMRSAEIDPSVFNAKKQHTGQPWISRFFLHVLYVLHPQPSWRERRNSKRSRGNGCEMPGMPSKS